MHIVAVVLWEALHHAVLSLPTHAREPTQVELAGSASVKTKKVAKGAKKCVKKENIQRINSKETWAHWWGGQHPGWNENLLPQHRGPGSQG
eukprot:6462226-Amphidinium_carterae.2